MSKHSPERLHTCGSSCAVACGSPDVVVTDFPVCRPDAAAPDVVASNSMRVEPGGYALTVGLASRIDPKPAMHTTSALPPPSMRTQSPSERPSTDGTSTDIAPATIGSSSVITSRVGDEVGAGLAAIPSAGVPEGDGVGSRMAVVVMGAALGAAVGFAVGSGVGAALGAAVGFTVGPCVGGIVATTSPFGAVAPPGAPPGITAVGAGVGAVCRCRSEQNTNHSLPRPLHPSEGADLQYSHISCPRPSVRQMPMVESPLAGAHAT
mmetsp:Transcript_70421/g.190419  ORF Transcript_70421/g.190419 Transcript_70421/m.190419 type:complete len:264 (+) Transcript_70421:111-902(+)